MTCELKIRELFEFALRYVSKNAALYKHEYLTRSSDIKCQRGIVLGGAQKRSGYWENALLYADRVGASSTRYHPLFSVSDCPQWCPRLPMFTKRIVFENRPRLKFPFQSVRGGLISKNLHWPSDGDYLNDFYTSTKTYAMLFHPSWKPLISTESSLMQT